MIVPYVIAAVLPCVYLAAIARKIVNARKVATAHNSDTNYIILDTKLPSNTGILIFDNITLALIAMIGLYTSTAATATAATAVETAATEAAAEATRKNTAGNFNMDSSIENAARITNKFVSLTDAAYHKINSAYLYIISSKYTSYGANDKVSDAFESIIIASNASIKVMNTWNAIIQDQTIPWATYPKIYDLVKTAADAATKAYKASADATSAAMAASDIAETDAEANVFH